MKVFISWSGDRGLRAAQMLHEWLPYLVRDIEPWISSIDIQPGSRWNSEIASQLDATDFGIVCLTSDSLTAPWLQFEAGAIAKSIRRGNVVPFLIGIEPSDVVGPLVQFQAIAAEKESTWRLVKLLNENTGDGGVDEKRLRNTFEKFWPDLARDLASLPVVESGQPTRTDRSILTEVLEVVRPLSRSVVSIARAVKRLETRVDDLMSQARLRVDRDSQEGESSERLKLRALPPPDRDIIEIVSVPTPDATLQAFLNEIYFQLLPDSIPAYTYGDYWYIEREEQSGMLASLGRKDRRTLEEMGIDIGSRFRLRILRRFEEEGE